MSHQSFSGKSTSIGNSNGFRFDAALFKANPEFFGEVRGTVWSQRITCGSGVLLTNSLMTLVSARTMVALIAELP